MSASVLGRDWELAAVGEFVEACERGPAALAFEGDAGLGKTTLWAAACAAARERGQLVLTCRGDPAEARMGYAVLADLLADVPASDVDALPPPQQEGLNAALLRARPADGAPPDPRAVATGFVSLLERLAGERPVVVAVDDLQWLDASSAEAIRFAGRRVGGPIGFLSARRDSERHIVLRHSAWTRVIALRPLAAEHVRRLVQERTDRVFTRTMLERIGRTADGNPFVALELARALDAGRETFPKSLRELVDARIAGLRAEVLDTLLHAAALTRPRIAWLQRALAGEPVAELLGEAEAAGVVEVELDRVRFAHPLLADGVYAAATGSQRKAAHRRLAVVVEDPEERARHLGLASVEADPQTVAALEAGAAAARARGAPADAADLLELALELGATDPARMTQAAEDRFAAGDTARARALLEPAIASLPRGADRSRAVARLGTIRTRDDGFGEGAVLLEQALAECPAGAARVALTLELAYVLANAGRNADAHRTVAPAVHDATALGDDGLLGEALAVTAMVRFLYGAGLDRAMLTRALALEDHERRTIFSSRPSVVAAILLHWVGDFEAAERTFVAVRQICTDRGEESELVYASRHTAGLACWRGDVERARRIVADGLERAWQLDSRMARALALSDQATVAAWTGDVDSARQAGTEALGLFEQTRSFAGVLVSVGTLGSLELALGAPADAAMWLAEPSAAAAAEVGDPAIVPFVADTVEALAGADRVEEAAALTRWYEARAAALGRPALEALALRCRGILLAADGNAEEAEGFLRRALEAHSRFPIAFEQARTRLVLGRLQRRRRARAAARASLEDAHTAFDSLGAALWAASARTELDQLGLRRSAGVSLTPSERRIAELAATGMTNRAVAAALFVSPKTVEATLSRAYRKLGITSRAQLGMRMSGSIDRG